VTDRTIAFIGGGNMASSLISGLLARGWPPGTLVASDPDPATRERLSALGLRSVTGNAEAVEGADVVVLAVKPQQMRAVCADIRATVEAHRPLIISIAAGIETPMIAQWLGDETAIVRCMPNTPAKLQCGASVLYATPRVTESGRRLAHEILESVGLAAWVDREDLMHAVTALSGSGPAYVFLVLEAMELAGETLGLEAGLARRLAAQTVLGAARMALEEGADVVDLRRRVTSPGGTTERALRVLENNGLRRLFESAMDAAAERSRELAAES
jgi:pyrroline-5-carboxylate reductase